METFVFLYTTFPDEASAGLAARALVGARLAACANIIAGMQTIYRYEGEIAEGRDVVAIFKLPARLKQDAASLLRRHHPYATPVVAFLEVEPDLATATWLVAETRDDRQV